MIGIIFLAIGIALTFGALWSLARREMNTDSLFHLSAAVTFFFALLAVVATARQELALEGLMVLFMFVAWKIAYDQLKKRETPEY